MTHSLRSESFYAILNPGAHLRLGRNELKTFANWHDGQPQTELNFNFYRQATNEFAGIYELAGMFLSQYF